ncbi:MAG: GNAT family N-acetyltransferase [Anaerolineaceae bacterium]
MGALNAYNYRMNRYRLSITTLAPDDWQEYKNIRLECLKLEAQAFHSRYEDNLEYPDGYWKDKLCDPNKIYLFARWDHQIIGTINAALNETGEDASTAEIHGFYVNAAYRGMGIGKLLIETLIGKIKETAEISRIRLWVKETQLSARHVYESMGFVLVERAGEHALVMEKQLTD